MSEPVEYQYRTRPDWIPEWNGWNTCSKESAEAYEKNSYLHDWHYEVRRLYTTPPQRKPLSDEEILNIHALRCWPRTMFADKSYGIALDTVTVKDFTRAVEAAHNIKEQP